MVEFSLEGQARNFFTLERSGNYSTELYLSHLLDREARSSYDFQIFAIDRGSPSLLGSASISIEVLVRKLKL